MGYPPPYLAGVTLYLTKLHGSTNWHMDADGKIVESRGVEYRDVGSDIMIAPTEGSKRYDAEPFPALMDRFRREINGVDMLLVIGFSYRDGEIADIIRDRANEGMALISVSPNAEYDIRRVYDGDTETVVAEGRQFKIAGPQIYLHEQEFVLDTVKDVFAALDGACAVVGHHLNASKGDGDGAP